MNNAAPDWVFLDLDNTLWDFDGNAEEALEVLFHKHDLHLKSGHSVSNFIGLYKKINATYWRRYEQGEVQKDYLRTARFTDTFLQMGIPESEHPENIWNEYLEICPVMTRMIPDAHLLLEMCSANAQIGLITNGFESTQHIKLKSSEIESKVAFMVTSEASGFAKPDARIFQKALEMAGVLGSQAIYIGDTLDTDVKGGINAGLRTLWLNSTSAVCPKEVKENPLFLGSFQSLLKIMAYMSENWTWH
jgi:putative hydrolase of the HAD superfamily